MEEQQTNKNVIQEKAYNFANMPAKQSAAKEIFDEFKSNCKAVKTYPG